MRRFQKEPNDMLSFVFFSFSVRGGRVEGGGRIYYLLYYLLFISNYLEFKHYFSLITSSDVKTVKVKKKIISSSEYFSYSY